MIDNWTVPGFNGDDKEQQVEKATFTVTRDGKEGYIYYDDALIYDRQEGAEEGDDLFDALVGLGKSMAAKGYVEFVERDGGRGCE